MKFPKSYVVIIKNRQNRFGYVIIYEGCLDSYGFFDTDKEYIALRKIKKILKQKRYKIKIYQDIQNKYRDFIEWIQK